MIRETKLAAIFLVGLLAIPLEVGSSFAQEVGHAPVVEVGHAPVVEVGRAPVKEVGSWSDRSNRNNDETQQNCDFSPVEPDAPKSAMLQNVTVTGVSCQGVQCEISKGFMASEVHIRMTGGDFSAYENQTLGLTVTDTKNRRIIERRTYTDWIDLALMPSGNFVFVVTPVCSSTAIASGRFTINRVDPNAGKRSKGGKNFDPSRYCFPNCGYVSPSIYQ